MLGYLYVGVHTVCIILLNFHARLNNHVFSGAGAYAGCTYCSISGEYSKILTKMVYLSHRSFLPSVDHLLSKHKGFPDKLVKPCPSPKTMAYIDSANAQYCAASSITEKKRLSQVTGCKGPYSLRRLPFHDRYMNTPVEPMHLLKNIAEHIVKLVSGVTDSVKSRREEEHRHRFRGSWVKLGDEAEQLPPAPFRLDKQGVSTANRRALSIKVPHGTNWKRRQLFSKSYMKQMKSSEWRLVLSSGILKYCLRGGILGKLQQSTLFELCDVVKLLTDDFVKQQDIDAMEYRLHRALSLVERDFPVSLNVIVFHLLHHLPLFIRRFGPVRGYWMYPMERFNSWIARRVLNRRFPEATVLQTYRVFELSFFLQISGQLTIAGRNASVNDLNSFLVESGEPEHEEALTSHLDETKMKDLDDYYRRIDNHYSALIDAYEHERDAAKKSHHLRVFPPMNLWNPVNLTPAEMKLCSGPSRTIECFQTFNINTEEGFKVKYSTHNPESSSIHDSSYVHLNINSPFQQGNVIKFGRIQMIFRHIFNHNERVLAYITWFESTLDRDSGLYTLDLQSQLQFPAIVSIRDLSRPLVHAYDQEDNQVWILNI